MVTVHFKIPRRHRALIDELIDERGQTLAIFMRRAAEAELVRAGRIPRPKYQRD